MSDSPQQHAGMSGDGFATQHSDEEATLEPRRHEGYEVCIPALRTDKSCFVLFVSSWFKRSSFSNPFPIELRLAARPEELERAVLADRVGPVEDPVLPGREAAEDLGLDRLGAGEAQA